MTKEELMLILSAMPDDANVIVDIGERYAEIKGVKVETSQRINERKLYVIIDIYK